MKSKNWARTSINGLIQDGRPRILLAALFVALAMACVPSARAAGVVKSCDETSLLTALNGGGPVTFSCSGTITLTSTITISNDTTIDGTGETVTISGGNTVGVFIVPTGVKLNLHNLTIANAFSNDPLLSAITNNSGTLTVTNSTLSGNDGAIANNSGTLTVTNSTFSGNYSFYSYASAIANNSGTVTVTNSSLSGNLPYFLGGGAITNDNGTMRVIESTFSGNQSATLYEAGAITNENGTLIVTNSTFSGNVGGVSGDISNFATTAVTNSTFSGSGAAAEIDRVGIINNSGTLTLQNSIVASSKGGNCYIVAGALIDGGGNLVTDNTCGTILQSPDPLLGPLQYNGGRTQTMALGTNSPAIANALEANCPIRDQRGFPRPFPGLIPGLPLPARCSIGAYEPGTLFRSFLPYAAVNLTNPASPSFAVIGTFTLRADNDGVINPLTDLVQFRLGTFFSTTISPNSFQLTNGSFVYVQSVNGSPVFRMTIRALGGAATPLQHHPANPGI
jgi:hypothetical protein